VMLLTHDNLILITSAKVADYTGKSREVKGQGTAYLL
jgi:hypothetical protein